MGDRWGDDEWDHTVTPPSTLWVRLTVVYVLGAVGLAGIVGAAWEYRNWQDSKIPSAILPDWSPSAYPLATIVFLVIGLLAVGASWMIWARRDRSDRLRRSTVHPAPPSTVLSDSKRHP